MKKERISGMSSHDNRYAGALIFIFLILGALNASRHEMWRDEIQAWLLAKDSSSPVQLLKNLKYEGHPGVWHLSLFPLSRITPSPIAMQPFHLIIACLSVYLFLRFSPFTKVQKALFTFGYFPFYEYCVICRNYAPGLFLLLLFCSLLPRRSGRFPLLGLILFFLAHTSVHALILVISICLGLSLDILLSKDRPNITVCLGFLLIVSGIITSVVQLNPPPDSGFAVGWKTDFDLDHLKKVFNLIPRAFIPIPRFTFHFWNTAILDQLPASEVVKLSLGCLILLYGILLFIRKPAALLIYLIGTLGLCSFFYTKYFGSMRHHGFLFISFVSSIWISNYCRDVRIFNPIGKLSLIIERSLNKVLTVILFIHLAGGVAGAVMDYMYVFSQGKATADFIRREGMEGMLIVGDTDFTASTVVGYLEREIYYPRGDRVGSFVIWDKKRTEPLTVKEILERAVKLSLREKKDCLLVLNYRLSDEMISRYSLKEIARFEKAVVGDEVYYLYLRHYSSNMMRHI